MFRVKHPRSAHAWLMLCINVQVLVHANLARELQEGSLMSCSKILHVHALTNFLFQCSRKLQPNKLLVLIQGETLGLVNFSQNALFQKTLYQWKTPVMGTCYIEYTGSKLEH